MAAKKIKPGKVIRLTPDLAKLVLSSQLEGESIPDVLRRLLNLTGEVSYVLPSDLHSSAEEARGAAVLRAVKMKEKRIERPLAVRRKD